MVYLVSLACLTLSFVIFRQEYLGVCTTHDYEMATAVHRSHIDQL